MGSTSGFDIYLLLFLALSVFAIIKLKAILGTRTGFEDDRENKKQSRFFPSIFSLSEEKEKEEEKENSNLNAEIKILLAEQKKSWLPFAEDGSDLAKNLDKIAAKDLLFSLNSFMEGAMGAYEMIIQSFANHDRAALKPLLSPEVFNRFSKVINEREAKGEKVTTQLVRISKTEIVKAELGEDYHANITVRFVAELISVTRDKEGAVIHGSPDQLSIAGDVWVFSRDTGVSDPNWILTATDSIRK